MLETTNKLIEEMDELKKMVMTEVIHGNIDIDIEDMSEIKFLMKSFKALNLSMRLMKEQAEKDNEEESKDRDSVLSMFAKKAEGKETKGIGEIEDE